MWQYFDVLFVVRKVILAATALLHCATTLMAWVISHRKFPHQDCLVTMIDHDTTHVMITTTETDHTLSITDTAKEIALTVLDHTITLDMTKALVTTGDTHPTLYPTTTAACDTPLPTDALGDTSRRTPHTVTDATHP